MHISRHINHLIDNQLERKKNKEKFTLKIKLISSILFYANVIRTNQILNNLNNFIFLFIIFLT